MFDYLLFLLYEITLPTSRRIRARLPRARKICPGNACYIISNTDIHWWQEAGWILFERKKIASIFIGTWSVFSVTIVGAPFKGFFLQARDINTNKWIGSWTRTPNTNVHSECSAVTHADPRDKEQATFIWNAPANGRGSVYFTWVPCSSTGNPVENARLCINDGA